MISRFVKRFPAYGSRVEQALARDQVMVELCHDYDVVLEDLEAMEQGLISEQPERKLFRELSRLKTELESEVLERLAGYNGTEGSEPPG